LKGKPKEFLAATGLYLEEYKQLLPVFKRFAVISQSPGQTRSGQP